jgi:hypothetical protein
LQSGAYSVTFYATDDSLAVDSEVVSITVNEGGNQAPVLAAIGAQVITENANLNFVVSATDIESTPVITSSALPTGATFDGTTFDWTPGFTDAGLYSVTFYATDDSAAVDSELVSITVTEAGNQLPVLASIGPQLVQEGSNLNFAVSSTDAESTPTISTSTLPGSAVFTPDAFGGGIFAWNPGFDDAGDHDVTFYATDSDLGVDSEVVTITVTNFNRVPVADAGPDQVDAPNGSTVTLDGTGSTDPDLDPLNYDWQQISGGLVLLSSATDSMPTFTVPAPGLYSFTLQVDDGSLFSNIDTVNISAINAAPPAAITDLTITINAGTIDLSWSAITVDSSGFTTTIDHYVIYRGTKAYFTPTSLDSIAGVSPITLNFNDNNLGGADVVGDTLTNYFYTVEAVDQYGNRAKPSNRVGEYDYQLVATATTNFNLVGIPFANTGISNANELITALGATNVLTVNNFVPASQSFESRFAAGFGVNFAVNAGGVYQVNSATDTVFSIAGSVPDSGTISYPTVTTATTNFSYLMIPFELEDNFANAQDLLNGIPGVLNTLNNFVAGSQSYQSRFAAGFGVNFPVRAGKPYQGNAAVNGVFPGP